MQAKIHQRVTTRRLSPLPFVAAMFLVGHLLGPHTEGHSALLTGFTALSAGHDGHAGHGGRDDTPGGHDSADHAPCGYPCSRDTDEGTAGSFLGWVETAPGLHPPPATDVPVLVNGARAPPDPVRELQVIRV